MGEPWRHYQIEGPAPSASGQAFYATPANLTEKVVIWADPVTEATIWRRGAWERFGCLPPEARIVGCVEALEEGGWRYEVMRVPPASTMRDWITCNRASPESLRVFLRQLSATLAALHAQGVVHLNIRPDSIYLDDSAETMQVWLGGTECATLYTNPGVRVAAADPFYAPPETSGMTEFPPGTGLCAWDWWSVGRVIQEFVIGRHVACLLFEGDVTRPAPEFLAQVRNLIRDCDPMMPRAGAVEAMPEMEPAVQVLLSGLLTSACDARWRQSHVERWLKGETVKTYYELSRSARMFSANGRNFTLAEAVAHFSAIEHWAEGESNLLPPGGPETLARFLSTAPDHAADYARLQSCLALLELPAWHELTAKTRNTLVVSAAWLLLGSRPDKKRSLQVRGRNIDQGGLTAWLTSVDVAPGLESVRAMLAEPFINLIEPCDAAAAGLLRRLSQVSAEAIRGAREAGWLKPEDQAALARLLSLSLDSDSALRAGADKIRKSYATARDAGVLRLLKLSKAEPWEQVLLLFTAGNPSHYGFLSQEEWDRQRMAELHKDEERLAAVIFWSKLNRVLTAGSVWTVRWPVFNILWVGVALIGYLVAHDPRVTSLLVAGLVGGRMLLSLQVKRLVRLKELSAQPWRLMDSQRRCLTELQRVDPHGLSASLAAGPGLAGAFNGLWATLGIGTLALLVLAAQLGNHREGALGRDGIANPHDARISSPGRPLVVKDVATVMRLVPNISADLARKVVSGEYEIVNEGFGLQVNGPLRKWAFTPPTDPAPLPVLDQKPATPDQRAFAAVSALLLLKAFGQRPINAIIGVQVPAASGFELMLIDGRQRRPTDNQSLQLKSAPVTETWYRHGRFCVIFLATPEAMISPLPE